MGAGCLSGQFQEMYPAVSARKKKRTKRKSTNTLNYCVSKARLIIIFIANILIPTCHTTQLQQAATSGRAGPVALWAGAVWHLDGAQTQRLEGRLQLQLNQESRTKFGVVYASISVVGATPSSTCSSPYYICGLFALLLFFFSFFRADRFLFFCCKQTTNAQQYVFESVQGPCPQKTITKW